MPDTPSLVAFVAAALVALLIPGPAVLYIVARSLAQGRRAGLLSVAGLSLGALVHVAAATAGLSAILVASATAFSVVKLLGAGYLIYLGVRAILEARRRDIAAAEPPIALVMRTRRRIFAEGVLISVLNPKIAVFFLAFLPQFVDPALGGVTRQILFLGLLYVGLALITDGLYALLAGSVGQLLAPRLRKSRLPGYASGALYIGLGVSAAFAGRRQ
jgi:threonine/homoserine/homoserine lactone efflux protein